MVASNLCREFIRDALKSQAYAKDLDRNAKARGVFLLRMLAVKNSTKRRVVSSSSSAIIAGSRSSPRGSIGGVG
jgi:hypothetical protein